MERQGKVLAAITIGDVNGIGTEVLLKTFLDERMFDVCTPIVYGSGKVLDYYSKALNLSCNRFYQIREAGEAEPRRLNVINLWEEEIDIKPGKPDKTCGRFSLMSLDTALNSVKTNHADVLITAPVTKYTLSLNGHVFHEHTSYLADMLNVPQPMMLMVGGDLRVGTVTNHIPMSRVAGALSAENIYWKIRTLSCSLKSDFGILKPEIAVTGLNPHAGEQGLFGPEEQDTIIPAIEKAKSENILVTGPYPADGLFGSSEYRKFDAILAMYHDQAMIPFKALSSGEGVNFTAGLPIVRTSPAHGTAYDIAGKNMASEKSFREAVLLACQIWKNRQKHFVNTL